MARRLDTYRKKRDFSRTPEPAPERKRPGKKAKPTFMVHKHDATRLHYDLRLEMDGALASWAVPKGPSYDPTDRRLAVQTEDHPLSYGGFEGRIPEGEYGAGDSIIWDRGTYDTEPPGQASEMRRKGHIVFVLDGEKLQGRWHLVRTRQAGSKEQWMLFKGKDEFATPAKDIVAERPESVVSGRKVTRGPIRKATREADHPAPMDLLLRIWPPMLATLTTAKELGKGRWVFEVKYDGFRALGAVSGGKVALQSRNGLDLSARFPGAAKALAKLEAAEAVVDGEIIAFDSHGRATFEALQTSAPKQRYVLFDLLWLDGEDLRDRPLSERRELLSSLLANTGEPLALAERLGDTLPEAMATAKERGLEGVMAKLEDGPYRGTRSREWLKLKLLANQELAIVGYLPLSTGEKGIGALLVAVRDGKSFKFAGKVGTGYSNKVRLDLQKKLDADRVEKPTVIDPPRYREAVWVTPKLVAEIAFTEWTRDGKLRHPSFKGLRADKRPEECVREVPVSAATAAPASASAPARTGRRASARASAPRPSGKTAASRTTRTKKPRAR